jgi:membrane protease YdiL (CAAX protease family)
VGGRKDKVGRKTGGPIHPPVLFGKQRFVSEAAKVNTIDRHIEKFVKMLQSPQASIRYEACKHLRAAPGTTPEAIQALQDTLKDPEESVAEAAQRALSLLLAPGTLADASLRAHSLPENSSSTKVSDKTRHIVTWLLIGTLFILRNILLVIGGTVFRTSDTRFGINTAFQIGTYLITAVLIWWERENLTEFFIDKMALVIFIFARPLSFLLEPHLVDDFWLSIPVGLGLLIALMVFQPKLQKVKASSWFWVFVGVLAGILSGVLIGFLLKLQPISFRTPEEMPFLTWKLVITLPILQIANAAVFEEPFFRGFLWGGLRRAGWKDIWILLFQGVLFILGHLYYLGTAPVSFWIIVPIGGFLFGLLAWQSRSIGTSMVAHGFSNAVGQMVAYYRF